MYMYIRKKWISFHLWKTKESLLENFANTQRFINKREKSWFHCYFHFMFPIEHSFVKNYIYARKWMNRCKASPIEWIKIFYLKVHVVFFYRLAIN